MNGAVETQFACTLSDCHAGLQGLMNDAETFLAAHYVPEPIIAQLMIALDEIISNIFHHGARDGEPNVEVVLHVQPDRVAAQISDDGIAFDPLQSAAPDTSLSSDERPIGGLGIFLVRRLMDDVRYDRDHGRNRLIFHKVFGAEGAELGVSAP